MHSLATIYIISNTCFVENMHLLQNVNQAQPIEEVTARLCGQQLKYLRLYSNKHFNQCLLLIQFNWRMKMTKQQFIKAIKKAEANRKAKQTRKNTATVQEHRYGTAYIK